jgi:hypothetical protein
MLLSQIPGNAPALIDDLHAVAALSFLHGRRRRRQRSRSLLNFFGAH